MGSGGARSEATRENSARVVSVRVKEIRVSDDTVTDRERGHCERQHPITTNERVMGSGLCLVSLSQSRATLSLSSGRRRRRRVEGGAEEEITMKSGPISSNAAAACEVG